MPSIIGRQVKYERVKCKTTLNLEDYLGIQGFPNIKIILDAYKKGTDFIIDKENIVIGYFSGAAQKMLRSRYIKNKLRKIGYKNDVNNIIIYKRENDRKHESGITD